MDISRYSRWEYRKLRESSLEISSHRGLSTVYYSSGNRVPEISTRLPRYFGNTRRLLNEESSNPSKVRTCFNFDGGSDITESRHDNIYFVRLNLNVEEDDEKFYEERIFEKMCFVKEAKKFHGS